MASKQLAMANCKWPATLIANKNMAKIKKNLTKEAQLCWNQFSDTLKNIYKIS